ncbi:MAG: hypothetical protein ACPGTO_07610 [Polaribacter sp.]
MQNRQLLDSLFTLLKFAFLISMTSCSIFKSQKVELEGKLLSSDFKIPLKAELVWFSGGKKIAKSESNLEGDFRFDSTKYYSKDSNVLIVKPLIIKTFKDTVLPYKSKIGVICKDLDTISFNPAKIEHLN